MNRIDPAIVEARNQLNGRAMAAQAELLAILTPWLGRKIRKTSGYGGWVAKLEPVIREFSDRSDRTWLTCQHGWLALECQSMLQLQPHGVSYSKAQLSIGKVDETGVLLELFQPTELRTDYTTTEVEFARARAFELEQQARDLRHKIREFER
jgi:hypothetical protein